MITESPKPHGHNGKSGFPQTNNTKNHHLYTAIHRSDIVGGRTVGEDVLLQSSKVINTR